MKVCIKCKLSKPLENFELTYDKDYINSRRKICKSCRNEQRKQYNSRRGDGLNKQRLKYYYNMTPEDYIKMSKEQNNKCFLCKKINNFGRWKDKLVVDHCHKSNKVRKLLCDKCNKGLGQFNDDPELLIKAAQYIKDHTKA